MVVQSAGYVQFLANTGESVDRQREVIASMREHGISGLIISPARGTEAADLKPLAASGMPVVDRRAQRAGRQGFDRYVGQSCRRLRDAVRHLVGLGHRRIAFLGGFADTAVFRGATCRLSRCALRDGGICCPTTSWSSAPRRRGPAASRRSSRAMLLAERPTAALCFNDAVAFGVCDGLARPPPRAGRGFRRRRLRRRDRGARRPFRR